MLISFFNKNKKSITLSQNDNLILQDWSGFANSNISLVTNKAPNQIGTTIVKKIYNSRALSVQFLIRERTRQEVFDKRREIISVFNGKGVLVWQQNDNNTAYKIEVEVENLTMPSGDARGNTFQTVQVDFLAENPLWVAIDSKITQLAINNSSVITNEGDIEIPFELKITGPIDNPMIKNIDSNSEIKLDYNFGENEAVIINTEFGNKSVYVENENGKKYNAIKLLDLDSEMFSLEIGNNLISITGDNIDSAITSAEIEFYEKYLGV